eukprot:7486151-Pyramimonas_sp.AAC.1
MHRRQHRGRAGDVSVERNSGPASSRIAYASAMRRDLGGRGEIDQPSRGARWPPWPWPCQGDER